MKIKQKMLALLLMITAVIAVVTAVPDAFAAQKCGEVETSIIGCSDVDNDSGKTEDSAIWKIIIIALNILTAGVGIAAVGGIVYASVLYTSARDNASQTKQAKDIITNVVIGIVCYGLMYLGLNFLIPGGIID